MAGHDEKKNQSERKAGAEENAPLRHKGEDRAASEVDKKSGPRPEGNGGTGKPAAFPPHE